MFSIACGHGSLALLSSARWSWSWRPCARGKEPPLRPPSHGTLPSGWEVSAQVATLTVEEWRRAKAPEWTRAQAKVGPSQVEVQIRDEGRPEAFLYLCALSIDGRIRAG